MAPARPHRPDAYLKCNPNPVERLKFRAIMAAAERDAMTKVEFKPQIAGLVGRGRGDPAFFGSLALRSLPAHICRCQRRCRSPRSAGVPSDVAARLGRGPCRKAMSM